MTPAGKGGYRNVSTRIGAILRLTHTPHNALSHMSQVIRSTHMNNLPLDRHIQLPLSFRLLVTVSTSLLLFAKQLGEVLIRKENVNDVRKELLHS